MQMETLIASISKELSAEVKKRNISFHLGLSIGYVKIEPDEEINLENDLRLADQLMYSIKKIHHTEIDSEQSGTRYLQLTSSTPWAIPGML